MLVEVRESQLFDEVPMFMLGEPRPDPFPRYFLSQAWLRNEPLCGEVAATALNAFITLEQNGSPVYNEIRAQWVKANATSNMGFTEADVLNTWPELLPNGDIAKLLIAHKRTQDDLAYLWLEGADEYDGRRHPSTLGLGKTPISLRSRM